MNTAELLFTRYHRVILGLLLVRPDQQFHVRELARMTGFPVGTLNRQLRRLAEGGILLAEKQGNQVRYQANRACPVFEELAGLFRKTTGLAYVVRDALAPEWEHVDLALIFGSMASGTARPQSDLDLLVISERGLREIVGLLFPLQEELRREINPVVMTRQEFAAETRKGSGLLRRIMDEPKIFVKGTQHDFEELAQNGTA